jgi:mRNA-degrading endonuclease YafQ of YafQ-DinJ toxin-antitoxin module
MREIEFTRLFRRDYKRVIKGPHGRTLNEDLQAVVDLLAEDRRCPFDTSITRFADNGKTTEIAISNLISF